MELYGVFKNPFCLVSNKQEIRDNYKAQYLEYITHQFKGGYEKEEIYALSKMYLNNFVDNFKNYKISDEDITESSYRLCVLVEEDYELNEKHIYTVVYDNTKNKISSEMKFDNNCDIEDNFTICIKINFFVFYDLDECNFSIRKAIKEDDCVICYENKPDILFLDCLHFCVCNKCNSHGINRCPLCRKIISEERILI